MPAFLCPSTCLTASPLVSDHAEELFVASTGHDTGGLATRTLGGATRLQVTSCHGKIAKHCTPRMVTGRETANNFTCGW